MVLDFLIKALFVWRDLLTLFTVAGNLDFSKSNVSMVNWLADFIFNLDYRIAWWVRIKFSKKNTKKLLQASTLLASVILPACINSLRCTL